MRISWKKAACISFVPAASFLLTGCDEDWGVDISPGDHGAQIWVSDSGLSTWLTQDTTSQSIAFAPSLSSLTYWQQGPEVVFAAEKGACAYSEDDCGKLFYISGGKLFAVNTPAAGSTPVPRAITTQYTPGTVAWGGAGGSVLYVTYPNNAAVGVIGGVSEVDYPDASINPARHIIRFPAGTSPNLIAVGYPLGHRHYIVSGSPAGAQQLIAFDENGPISGLPTPSLSIATGLAANDKYVAVVAGGKLMVYNADLSFRGTVSGLSNPNKVVVNEHVDSSNRAYVTNLSAPDQIGWVNAVDLDTLSVVGPIVTVGKGPFNELLNWDGNLLFVANQNDGPPGTVSVLFASENGVTLQETVKVGTKPGVMTIHP